MIFTSLEQLDAGYSGTQIVIDVVVQLVVGGELVGLWIKEEERCAESLRWFRVSGELASLEVSSILLLTNVKVGHGWNGIEHLVSEALCAIGDNDVLR